MIPEAHFKIITAAIVFGTLVFGVFVPNGEYYVYVIYETSLLHFIKVQICRNYKLDECYKHFFYYIYVLVRR